MERRKWTAEQKARIVLEHLKGVPLGELCARHQISQTLFYKWRDQFTANLSKVFITDHTDEKYKREINKLKSIIGSLTIELKKSEDDL